MGFLAAAETVVLRAMAQAMTPPPPPDITRWCEDNIVFDERSPRPGPFSIKGFEFLREIHQVLSPEHPCREVTVRGSAQIAKTESIVNPTVAAWHENMPLNSLVVHPTGKAAGDWVDQKWGPLRRSAPSMVRMFGRGGGSDNADTKFRQETFDRTGILKVTSAGSPDDLAQTSHRLIVLDDLSKFEMHPKGDPEEMAASRAESFEDAKILAASTPQIMGACRITRRFLRSDQRFYHVPCPHCGNMAPLTWENFRARIDPENLSGAHFSCESCGGVIEHHHKAQIVAAGRWVPRNPRGDHPGFHLWRAYAPQRDWASVAHKYAQVMGWTSLGAVESTSEAKKTEKVEAETEQTFWNDVLGLPFEQASGGPDWEALRDRAEAEEVEALPRGIVPACGVILTAGVDCQLDRIEVTIAAFGRNLRRWTVDHVVIPHHVGDQEGWAALDALLKSTWRTALGLRLPLDMLAIDSGNWTEDVYQWGKRHPWNRVILVKGGSSANGPVMAPQKFERRANGKARKAQRRAFMVNVSQLKGDFYGWLGKADPEERGHVQFARDMGDEYFRQITAEVRVLRRATSGVTVSRWELAEPGRRNEALDCMLYAEAAARRKGWASMTDQQWQVLEAQRSVAGEEPQGDLFDATVPAVPAAAKDETEAAQAPAKQATPPAAEGGWINPKKGSWL